MSIQMTVCSPFHYFKDWIGECNPQKLTKIFVSNISKKLGIQLENAFLDDEIFCEDFSASVLDDMNSFIYEESNDCDNLSNSLLGGDIYFPYNFNPPQKIKVKYSSDSYDLFIYSNSHCFEAIKTVETIMKPDYENYEIFCQILASLKEGINISNKHKQPIFWSY